MKYRILEDGLGSFHIEKHDDNLNMWFSILGDHFSLEDAKAHLVYEIKRQQTNVVYEVEA